MNANNRFWETTPLIEMTRSEWESVCDGCAKCCLSQLQDEDTDERVFTDVACDLLDSESCRCTDYKNRSERVPQCMTMTASNVAQAAAFAPPTCAYRLLVEGRPLPAWHHLQCGDVEAVHKCGQSVRNRVRHERDVVGDDLEDYVVYWPGMVKD